MCAHPVLLQQGGNDLLRRHPLRDPAVVAQLQAPKRRSKLQPIVAPTTSSRALSGTDDDAIELSSDLAIKPDGELPPAVEERLAPQPPLPTGQIQLQQKGLTQGLQPIEANHCQLNLRLRHETERELQALLRGHRQPASALEQANSTPPHVTAQPDTATGRPLISTEAMPPAIWRGWQPRLGFRCANRGSPWRATARPCNRTFGLPLRIGVAANPSCADPQSPTTAMAEHMPPPSTGSDRITQQLRKCRSSSALQRRAPVIGTGSSGHRVFPLDFAIGQGDWNQLREL